MARQTCDHLDRVHTEPLRMVDVEVRVLVDSGK